MSRGIESPVRRRLVAALAAAAGTSLVEPGAWAAAAQSTTAAGGGDRRMTQLMGANGWAGASADVAMWHEMGLTWGRDSVGPGQRNAPDEPMNVDMTGPRFTGNLPATVLGNNRNGFKTLLLLGYTPAWNASVPGDILSAPRNESVWERYVRAAVSKYAAPPYNVTHFQIWNEAAGPLLGGSPQATFWHGMSARAANPKSAPYDNAMQDYVERIHIPAARIIRQYGGKIVYGGWPDQGGLQVYMRWLEFTSPSLNARMIDWVDYLDTHYLPVDALTPLYDRYVATGRVRGIWQTEIGDRYLSDPHYAASYYFRFATWALERQWNDPDKYVSLVYHWEGVEPFRLTHRGNPRTYNPSGRSLVVLHKIVPGALRRFTGTLAFSPGASGMALHSDGDIVLQVKAPAGQRTVTISGIDTPASRYAVLMTDAVTGEPAPPDTIAATGEGGQLQISFKVPDAVNGAGHSASQHLAYLVVRPVA